MKTHSNDGPARQAFPHGRWNSQPAPLTRRALQNTRLRTLFWNLDESQLALEAAERLELLLETASTVTPPFLTGMDCPMPEAA